MVFIKKLVLSSWVVVGIMLSVCMIGCISIEFIGLFWLGEDGEIMYYVELVFVLSCLGLEYILDFCDR